MTTPTSTRTSPADCWPVSRSTNASAISWPRDQGIALGLAAVGVLLQCGVRRHTLGDRQQRGQLDHRVGSRANGDPPVRLCAPRPLDERLGIEPVGNLLAHGLELAITKPLEALGIARHEPVDFASVLEAEARRLAGEDRHPPLAQPAVAPGDPGVRHLVVDDVGESKELAAAVVGLPAGQADLGRCSATLP